MGRVNKPPKPLPKDTVPPSFAMTAAELRAREINAWPEKDFQQRVINLAESLGYLVYHTHDSRRSQPGFPDQKLWGEDLLQAGADFDFWYPKDWASGKIMNQLKGGNRA